MWLPYYTGVYRYFRCPRCSRPSEVKQKEATLYGPSTWEFCCQTGAGTNMAYCYAGRISEQPSFRLGVW